MLTRKTYFIREHVGFMKLTDTYDILDPETQDHLGIAKEKAGGFMKLLRLLINKRILPTKVFIYEGSDPNDESKLLFSIQRGFTLFRSKVDVLGPDGALVGWFKSKVWSIGECGASRGANSAMTTITEMMAMGTHGTRAVRRGPADPPLGHNSRRHRENRGRTTVGCAVDGRSAMAMR